MILSREEYKFHNLSAIINGRGNGMHLVLHTVNSMQAFGDSSCGARGLNSWGVLTFNVS